MCDDHPEFLFPSLGLHPIQGSYAVPEDSSACSISAFNQYKVQQPYEDVRKANI